MSPKSFDFNNFLENKAFRVYASKCTEIWIPGAQADSSFPEFKSQKQVEAKTCRRDSKLKNVVIVLLFLSLSEPTQISCF